MSTGNVKGPKKKMAIKITRCCIHFINYFLTRALNMWVGAFDGQDGDQDIINAPR